MMGFIHIRIIDVVDILAVAILFYYLYRMAKGTNTPSIIVAIISLYILWVVTRMLNLELLSSILNQIISVGVIALIVVFQPEIRQFMQTIWHKQRGKRRRSWLGRLLGMGTTRTRLDVDPIVRATVEMAAGKTGALIVIRRDADLAFIAETGITIDAQTSAPLLENIFFKNAPLHDGAVVIEGNRIMAAKCVLPSTSGKVPKNWGMRHRAALGMSEISDAVIVVVSEETGGISIAREGAVERGIARDSLHDKLLAALDAAPTVVIPTAKNAGSIGVVGPAGASGAAGSGGSMGSGGSAGDSAS